MLAGRSRVVGLVLGALAAMVASVLLLQTPEPTPEAHPVVALVEDNLPPWFVAPGAPERIAGRVFHAEGLAFVELTLDIPGTARWRRTALVGTDGRFDFGPRPRGRYKVQAVTPGLESRWVQLDTAHERGDRTELYVYPPPREELGESRLHLPETRLIPGRVLARGVPLAFAAIQPVWYTGRSHGSCWPADELVLADHRGRFAVPASPLCGVTVYAGGQRFDVELPEPHREPVPEVVVVDATRRQPAGSILECGALYDHGDPRGAWLRGRVVDERGAPIADANVGVSTDMCGIHRSLKAYSRSDGSFELYLAEKEPDEQRAIMIFARERRGIAYVTVPPGQRRNDLVLEVGPGHVVEGRVLDEDGRPVEGAAVSFGDWVFAPQTPTGADGRFTTRIPVPGRLRLRAVRADERHREHAPLDGIGLAIDVEHATGSSQGIELRVHRTTSSTGLRTVFRDCFDLGLRADPYTYRVRAVRDEAEHAGIRVGDRVTSELPTDPLTLQAKDPLSSLSAPVCVPYGSTVRWWVQRDGIAEPFVVELRAPPIAVQ